MQHSSTFRSTTFETDGSKKICSSIFLTLEGLLYLLSTKLEEKKGKKNFDFDHSIIYIYIMFVIIGMLNNGGTSYTNRFFFAIIVPP